MLVDGHGRMDLGFKSCKRGEEKSHITVRFAGNAVIMISAENLRQGGAGHAAKPRYTMLQAVT